MGPDLSNIFKLLFKCITFCMYDKIAWEKNYNSVKFKLRKKNLVSIKQKLKINKLFKMSANFVLRILCFDLTRFLKNYKEVPSTKCDMIMSLRTSKCMRHHCYDLWVVTSSLYSNFNFTHKFMKRKLIILYIRNSKLFFFVQKEELLLKAIYFNLTFQ